MRSSKSTGFHVGNREPSGCTPVATSTGGVHFPPTRRDNQMPTSFAPSRVPPNQAADQPIGRLDDRRGVRTGERRRLEDELRRSLVQSPPRQQGRQSNNAASAHRYLMLIHLTSTGCLLRSRPIGTSRSARCSDVTSSLALKPFDHLSIGERIAQTLPLRIAR